MMVLALVKLQDTHDTGHGIGGKGNGGGGDEKRNWEAGTTCRNRYWERK